MKKIAVCTEEECRLRGKQEIIIDGREILIIYSNEKYFAVDNLCPHAKTRLIGGKIEDETITCANHGICFDLETGAIRIDKIDEDLQDQLDLDNLPFGALKVFPLTIENGMIMIEI